MYKRLATTSMLNVLHLVFSSPEKSVLYTGNYDPLLVSLSVVVGIFASYAALLVSQHASATITRTSRRIWIVSGGLCLGIGIWAMHFIGMLAFSLPCTTSYSATTTFLSTIPGILAGISAIQVISRRQLSYLRLAMGGVLLGSGIGAMHYAGMAAMHLNGLILYDAKLFLLSVFVAIVLATLALWIKFRLQSWLSGWNAGATLVSSLILGLAVSGMHYTAMASAYFIQGNDAGNEISAVSPAFLATMILVATCLILVMTIVATYVGKQNFLSLGRSYRTLGVLIVCWLSTAWLSSNYYYNHLANNLYLHESQNATQQAEEIAGDINTNIALLKGISNMESRDEDVRRALRRFGADVSPSTLAPGALKQSWPHDKILGNLNASLNVAATNLGADLIYIVNAAGDCISSSNADKADSFIGTNYADRDYFIQARTGQIGYQYAVGRTSKIPGLFYSAPVFEKGRFLGAAVVKRNITKFSEWINLANAFIVDANGVVVLAKDKRFEFRTVPNATAGKFSEQKILSQYKLKTLEPLEISQWEDSRFSSAVRIGTNSYPTLLFSKSLPDSGITIYVPATLTELERYGTERNWLFLLLATTGTLLIIAASSLILYVQESRKLTADLRIAASAFDSQEGMMVTDSNRLILRVNYSFTQITGYSAEEVIGKNPNLLSSGQHDADFFTAMWKSIDEKGAWKGEILNRRKSGEIYPEYLTITEVKDNKGIVSNYVATLNDISERRKAEEEIKNLAFYDPLTHLPNRRLLMNRLQQALAVSARRGRMGALIFIDLDNFKDLNDTLGHDVGDQLLLQAAARLEGCVRDGDTVARLGGDEFVVMLEDLSENHEDAATQAKMVGLKIQTTLNQPYILANRDCYSTSSMGITLINGHNASVDELLRQADLAMYQSKTGGRDTLRFFDSSMQKIVMARTEMESDLRLGIVTNQFLLYYQPQVNYDGYITGAEVLVRWQHPQRGMVSPAEFIPAAEETGLILALGHWVLETACSQLAAWSLKPETAHLSLAVNMSARQFHQHSFVDQVLVVLDGTGANPQKLKLELTESMLLDDVEDIISKMLELKARGVVFSLDDFGTGYSSLSYLKRLPLDQLKIDQSFVRDVLTDPNDAAIARTIVALGQSLGLAVIAEGVETSEQRDFLAGHGCHAYQGYFFGRPMPLGEFEQLLNRARTIV